MSMIDAPRGTEALALAPDALGAVMPMFLWAEPSGKVRAVGPTLAKIFGATQPEGRRLLDLITVTRPQRVARLADLRALAGRRLHLVLTGISDTALRGLAVPLADGGILLNLSFGISVAEAVGRLGLTDADFAPTDLAIEMLYLQEAKRAVMDELRGLTLRLDRAHRTALAEAQTDPLTGLANRRALEAALDAALARANRGGRGFALLTLDLDYFKQVNDRLGHAAGDALLGHVADTLRAGLRRGDLVARMGGDEFAMLISAPGSAEKVETMARRLIAALEQPVQIGGDEAQISASIGLVLSQDYAQLPSERLLGDADRALYLSKRQGRAQVTVMRPASAPAAQPDTG